MTYDFDEVIDRHGTSCLKYDFAAERGRQENVLPLWVADMDFKTAPGITQALQKAVDHGIFGYTDSKHSYFEAVHDWYSERFGWELKEEWLIKTPGVVFALAAAVRAFTKEGDAVAIMQPVYYPFSEVIADNDRVIVNSELINNNGHYEIDFADLERRITEGNAKLLLLCSPHNPVGRVWSREELVKLGNICIAHGVTVVSDEIHADFVYPGHVHTPFASISEEFADICITCTAPSKTFNIAGLQASNIFISNKELRARFKRAVDQAGYSQINCMGVFAAEAAYRTGGEWLDQLKEYLAGNLDFVRGYIAQKLPMLKLVEPEGTYLLWIDFRGLGLSEEELEDLISNKAKLWLDAGAIFGKASEGFERFNIACPRSVLAEAFDRIFEAVNGMSRD